MEPTTFERPQDFRPPGLEQHHDSEPGLRVGYFKKMLPESSE